MEKLKVGKIVSTHGIKGEIRILSDFPYKEKIFGVGKEIFVDEKRYVITSYRVHKNYDMVMLDGFHDINEVMPLMKKEVYVDKEKLDLGEDEILDEELLTYDVLTTSGEKGKVVEVFQASETNKIIRVLFQEEVLIPLYSPMVKEISKAKKQIVVELLEGMVVVK